jgi:hypothetical protein
MPCAKSNLSFGIGGGRRSGAVRYQGKLLQREGARMAVPGSTHRLVHSVARANPKCDRLMLTSRRVRLSQPVSASPSEPGGERY